MRNAWAPATMIGSVIIQHDKSTPSYDTALSRIAKKLGIEREDLCIITDGEQALIDACSTCFKNSTLLRSFKEDWSSIKRRRDDIRYCFWGKWIDRS